MTATDRHNEGAELVALDRGTSARRQGGDLLTRASWVLWWVGAMLFAGGLLLDWLTASTRWQVVAWRLVIDRPAAVVAILVLATVFWVAAATLWLLRPRQPGSKPRLWGDVAAALSVATLVGAIVPGLLALAAVSERTYAVLAPASPGGCRIVVQHRLETADSVSGGDLYLSIPGAMQLQDTHVNWQTSIADYDPVRAGTYALTWNGQDADLRIWGIAVPGEIDGLVGGDPIVCPK